MSDDMLIKQLLGRVGDCKLTCETYVDESLIVSTNVENANQIIKRRMVEQVALRILQDTRMTTWSSNPPSPEWYGQHYRVQTYVLSQEAISDLIMNAFAAGVESVVAV